MILCNESHTNRKVRFSYFILFTIFVCFCSAIAWSEDRDSLQTADTILIHSDFTNINQSKEDKVDSTQPKEILSNNEFNFFNNKSNAKPYKSNNTDWSTNISWMVVILGAILGAMVAYFHIDHISRPVITILIMENGSKVSATQPRIENTSKTDAEGTVILRLLIDSIAYHCDKTGNEAYSGKRIWYFPATNKEMKGLINLEKRIKEILDTDEIPKDKVIFLESCMHYRRFYPYSNRIRKWILGRFYYKVFSSPIQRWQLRDASKWVLVPNFELPQKPYDFDKKIFKNNPEKKNIQS